MPDNELEIDFGDSEPVQRWGPESGHERETLLERARELLAGDGFFDGLGDDTLASHIIEYAPDAIPLELRLRLRDLDVIEALSRLREPED